MESKIRSIVKSINNSSASETTLLSAYQKLQSMKLNTMSEKKLLAEVCFLLARRSKEKEDFSKAREFGRESIQIYEELGINKLDDAVPILYIYIPDIMHEDVVRNEFNIK